MREATRAREVRESATEMLRRRLDDALGRGVSEEAEDVSPEPPPSPDGSSARAGDQGHRGPERRTRFLSGHFAVVAIIALVGCAWAGFTLLSARTVAVPVVQTTSSTSVPAVEPSVGAAGAAASPSVAPSPSPTVLVHVLGAVRKPGLVRLNVGARVADAIKAAGGLRSDARPGQLNLAAVVADGSQVFVGTPASPGGELRGQGAVGSTGGATAAGGAASVVNLNTATAEQLEALPGVGPVTAQAILNWRSQHRFARVEQLQDVDGIGPKTFAKLAPLVTV